MSTIPNKKRIAIIGGGTNTYISNHLALSAPAYGTTARHLYQKFLNHSENKMQTEMYLTKMADPSQGYLDTPEDVESLVDELIADPTVRVIIFNVAMVDYKPEALSEEVFDNPEYTYYQNVTTTFGKYVGRLSTAKHPELRLELSVQDKIIQKIRKERKDILLVGFKTTCGATKEEQFQKGLKLCKDASANIVFVNDVDEKRIKDLNGYLSILKDPEEYLKKAEKGHIYFDFGPIPKAYLDNPKKFKRDHALFNYKAIVSTLQNNGLVTPEESSYWYNTRDEALDALVQMVLDRSHLHFTRSTVVDSETIPWNVRQHPDHYAFFPNPIIPETFRTVFDWVRSQGAYKKGPTGNTVGHFGIALGPNEFLTSKRKTDFNKIEEVGLVRVITDDPDNVFGYKHFFEESDGDKVIAFGSKPSVGGQSQRSLFQAFPDLNCIVHFHCPLRLESRKLFTTTPQFSYECGSYECIASNITGFQEYKVSETHSIWAGHMDHHGPNIVFNSDIDPQLVISFINQHWDLTRKTDGLSEDNK